MVIMLTIPSLCNGGMERVLAALADRFVCEGREVHLILFGLRPLLFYPLNESVTLHLPQEGGLLARKPWIAFQRMLFIRREVKKADPAVLLSFGEYWNSFVLLSLAGSGYPVFISDRCAPGKKLNGIHEAIRRLLYPRAAGIIVQTLSAEAHYHRRFPGLRTAVIPNPLMELAPGPPPQKRKQILMVARMISGKHHDRLISIFAGLDAPDWSLLLVGSDDQGQHHLERLRILAHTLRVNDRVIFAGETKDVIPYYHAAQIFAFTSSSEGFPNVINEALAAGLPVVSYDCEAGPSELIRDGENGYLVPLFDDLLFRERLQQLIDDEGLRQRMGQTAAEGTARFELAAVARRYLTFMEQNVSVPP